MNRASASHIADLGRKLSEWVARTSRGPLTVVKLVATSANGREDVNEYDDFTSPHELANEIFREAASDAEGRGVGLQISYQVLPYFGDHSAPHGVHHFHYFSPSHSSGERIEAPSATGLAQMSMRHLEQTQQLGFGVMARQLDNLTRQIESKDKQLALLHDKIFQLMLNKETLLNQQVERDVRIDERKAKLMKENADSLKENMVGNLLMQTLPMIGQKLMNAPPGTPMPGIAGIMGATQPAMEEVTKFFSALDASQQLTLHSALREDQRAELFRILSGLPEAK